MAEVTPLEPTSRESLPTLDQEAVARLFQHGLHEEGVFYNRLNFFLVFESLLFAATMTVLAEEKNRVALVIFMALIGSVASIVWLYAQLNKLVLLKTLEKRVEDECPEFQETLKRANERRIFKCWSANSVLAWFFPLLFVACWIAMIVFAVTD